MATGTAGTTARQFHTAQVHYLRKKVTFSTVGTTVTVGTIPAYATVIGGGIHTTTIFNGSTNTAVVGYIGNTTVAAAYGTGMSVATVAFVALGLIATATNIMQTVDTTVTVNITSGSASAGEAYVTIMYVTGFDT